MSTPPGLWSASKIVTLWPSFASSPATVRPAGPAPTTATFLPVRAGMAGARTSPCCELRPSRRRSARACRWRSARPSCARTHTASHCSSCGHTRPQMPGRLFFSLSFLTAPRKSPTAMSRMNPGMSISTGQPATHGAFLHCRHLSASCMGHLPRVAERDLGEVRTRAPGGPAWASAPGCFGSFATASDLRRPGGTGGATTPGTPPRRYIACRRTSSSKSTSWRRTPGRPRTRTGSCRRRSRGSSRTCRSRRS